MNASTLVPRDMGLSGKGGPPSTNPMSISYFIGRHVLCASADEGMLLWQDHVFMFLHKNSENPTDYFYIPANRVIELGMQVTI